MVRLGLLKLVVCFLAFAVTTLPASMLSLKNLPLNTQLTISKGRQNLLFRAFKNGIYSEPSGAAKQ